MHNRSVPPDLQIPDTNPVARQPSPHSGTPGCIDCSAGDSAGAGIELAVSDSFVADGDGGDGGGGSGGGGEGGGGGGSKGGDGGGAAFVVAAVARTGGTRGAVVAASS